MTTVADPFLGHAARDPGRVALSLTGGGAAPEKWTYGELRDRVQDVAAALRYARDDTGEPFLGLLLGNRGEFVELFLGAAVAGIPVMVLDPDWGAAEMSSVMHDTPPWRLFCESRLLDRAGSSAVAIDDPAGRLRPGDVGPGDGGPGDVGPGEASAVPEGAPFYVAFTSGSTGRPKGAVRTHRSWLRSFSRSGREFGITEGDHVLVPGALSHSHFLYGTLHGLAAGTTVHLLRRFAARHALDVLERHPIAHVYLVPTMCTALVDAAARPYRRVRTLLSAGAKWQPHSRMTAAEVFPEADAIEFYGATELSFVTVLHGGEGPMDSVGRPFDGVEISLRAADGTETAPSEPGVLYVRSDMLFTRYLSPRDPGRPDEHGWFTVGDVARLDPDGYVHLVGRAARMIITGGVNVYPEEVEAVLARLPEIAEAAVLGLPDPYWGEAVVAVVRWRGPDRLTRAEVRDRVGRHVQRAKCPRRIFETPAMPLTPGGKIATRILRDRLLAGPSDLREIA